MANNQNIPISAGWNPLAVGAVPADLNQLGTILAAQLSLYISAQVSFILSVTVDPPVFITQFIYNIPQNIFKGWDTGSASYLPISPFIIGDQKNTFVAGDNVNAGWIICNGRLISAIQGLAQNQVAALQSLFGINGSLPNLQPLQSLAGLPQNLSFSSINNPNVAPPTGQIGSLTFSNPPAQTEAQALAQNCEVLDDSTNTLQIAVAEIIKQSEAMLDVLNGNQQIAYTAVFVGFPKL